MLALRWTIKATLSNGNKLLKLFYFIFFKRVNASLILRLSNIDSAQG